MTKQSWLRDNPHGKQGIKMKYKWTRVLDLVLGLHIPGDMSCLHGSNNIACLSIACEGEGGENGITITLTLKIGKLYIYKDISGALYLF